MSAVLEQSDRMFSLVSSMLNASDQQKYVIAQRKHIRSCIEDQEKEERQQIEESQQIEDEIRRLQERLDKVFRNECATKAKIDILYRTLDKLDHPF